MNTKCNFFHIALLCTVLMANAFTQDQPSIGTSQLSDEKESDPTAALDATGLPKIPTVSDERQKLIDDMAAFYASHPVYEHYRVFYHDVIMQLEAKSAENGLIYEELEQCVGPIELRIRANDILDQYQPMLLQQMSELFEPIALEARELINSGKLALSEEEIARFEEEIAKLSLDEITDRKLPPTQNPFRPGTIDHLIYHEHFRLICIRTSEVLTNPIFKLPPDLEQRKKIFFPRIIDSNSCTIEPWTEPDPYIQSFKEMNDQIMNMYDFNEQDREKGKMEAWKMIDESF